MPMHKLATLAYLLHDNEVLLLYRNKKENDFHEGKFVGLGGRLEPGETPLECVIREIKEEAGYEFEPSEVTFRGYIYFDEVNRNIESEDLPAFNWLVFIYTATVQEKKVVTNSEGELQWFLKTKVPYENMWGGDRIFTPKILETDKILEGKFLYRNTGISWWTFGRDI
ncbi:MAG: NUDIX hydrolase [Candidatus Hodarchaeales archaeon]|jgi:8-oxo-dGTP diphosphatase